MAFGRLVSKWRILKSPLSVKMKNTTRMVYGCTHLHIHCINCNTQVYEHCVVSGIANATVYIVSGLQIMIIRNYEIPWGFARGVLHAPPWEYQDQKTY